MYDNNFIRLSRIRTCFRKRLYNKYSVNCDMEGDFLIIMVSLLDSSSMRCNHSLLLLTLIQLGERQEIYRIEERRYFASYNAILRSKRLYN